MDGCMALLEDGGDVSLSHGGRWLCVDTNDASE